ncbi:hypothetical protein PSEUDO9AG_10163 [Pseudomonas sp. 9Ag]|nr:hypothetical protein PSEUDO9AG_10163 [Pseudomonas sp. 9Ag]
MKRKNAIHFDLLAVRLSAFIIWDFSNAMAEFFQ